jgi:hypothetical protein
VAKKTAAKKRGSSTKAKSARSAKRTKPAPKAKAKAKAKRAKPVAKKAAKKKVVKSAARTKPRSGAKAKVAKRKAKPVAKKTTRKPARKPVARKRRVAAIIVTETPVLFQESFVGTIEAMPEMTSEPVPQVFEETSAPVHESANNARPDLFEAVHHSESHHARSPEGWPMTHEAHPGT